MLLREDYHKINNQLFIADGNLSLMRKELQNLNAPGTLSTLEKLEKLQEALDIIAAIVKKGRQALSEQED